ncbi:leucine carboxyl methyltransferase, putative [Theileria annulata]|uniref:Leucine carboxyl methyltransferase 1 n=1 Tax=Theileria annulata TaxID=5874 RepID=Q4UAG7_THEAN|nr:leucine carboxyl methyltransferase, putative [Theileria annulata]CAI76184.1 leucine carboxyl methyltransferase, putative [Theileria annulata]|eukprot:XP_952809.1 leucine carboxyl methyltransferase, putative [Theileria annulata]
MIANSPSEVVKTSHSVSHFKRSAVDKGYYKDDAINVFSSPSDESPSLDMFIYMRVTALRSVIALFVESFPNQTVQFVNLGAGLDTLSFWLLSKYNNVLCFDLDFDTHLIYKAQLLTKSNEFSFLNYKIINGLVHSDKYTMVPMNFEDLESVYKLEEKGLSRELPTVFLSEFCLTYVQNDVSDKVIKFLSSFSSKPSAYIFLDYIGSWTAFGRWYSKLFEDFGAEFKSFKKYDTIEKHTKRYKELGWDHVMVNPMSFTYNELIDEEERMRLKKLSKLENYDYFGVLPNHTVIGVAVTQKEKLSNLIQFYDMSNYKSKETSKLIPYDLGFRNDELDVEYFKKMLHSFVI